MTHFYRFNSLPFWLLALSFYISPLRAQDLSLTKKEQSFVGPQNLSILTLNVQLFPETLSSVTGGLGNDRRRMLLIASAIESLEEQPDIIAIQEFWADELRSEFLRAINSTYKHHFVGENPNFYSLGSGLALYSKHPIIKTNTYTYTNYQSWEGLANKGIMGALIKKKHQLVYIFNTHLQAEEGDAFIWSWDSLWGRDERTPKVIAKQLAEARDFILDFIGPYRRNKHIFLAGDLNTAQNSDNFQKFLVSLEPALDLACKDQGFDGTLWLHNGLIKPQKIDHIISFGKTPSGCAEIIGTFSHKLSDHLGVLARLAIEG